MANLDEEEGRKAFLFNHGPYQLASGRMSDFKIDCDALTRFDWYHLANLIAPKLPAFATVIGIPRGGRAWAEFFEPYSEPDKTDMVLLVDDVWTTGTSMSKYIPKHVPYIGVVLFARGPVPAWVTPVFTLNTDLGL